MRALFRACVGLEMLLDGVECVCFIHWNELLLLAAALPSDSFV